VATVDVHDLALDVLRHRLVLTYEAHADGVSADSILHQILEAVDPRTAGQGGTAAHQTVMPPPAGGAFSFGGSGR